jgi:hypothetical protein
MSSFDSLTGEAPPQIFDEHGEFVLNKVFRVHNKAFLLEGMVLLIPLILFFFGKVGVNEALITLGISLYVVFFVQPVKVRIQKDRVEVRGFFRYDSIGFSDIQSLQRRFVEHTVWYSFLFRRGYEMQYITSHTSVEYKEGTVVRHPNLINRGLGDNEVFRMLVCAMNNHYEIKNEEGVEPLIPQEPDGTPYHFAVTPRG